MRCVLAALLVLVGLVPATLHAAPTPTYGAVTAGTDLARSYFGGAFPVLGRIGIGNYAYIGEGRPLFSESYVYQSLPGASCERIPGPAVE